MISSTASNSKLLHLASTPVAMMSRYGLSTCAGLSGDDPADSRNKGVRFAVILSAFGDSALVGRKVIGELGPHEHYFIILDDELKKLGWFEKTTLCVVHRVPLQYVTNGAVVAGDPSDTLPDYSMYRTVVQYGLSGKGMGGVIYETPPNFNLAGKKPHFLSFSNKIYLSRDADSYLVFLNYSVSASYTQAADVKLDFYDAGGNRKASKTMVVAPLDFACVRVNDLIENKDDPGFYSFIASSVTSALIPLSVIVNKRSGGVSVEHSHPPQEYFMADWPTISAIKLQAAKYLFRS